MTTLTNEELILEFGWQLEVVRVSTQGRIPRIWRPPYGDVRSPPFYTRGPPKSIVGVFQADNRVRAIAEHVFGLQTVIWNHDSEDWELPVGKRSPCSPPSALLIRGPCHPGPQTTATLEKDYTTWITGPKSPGLIILSHELTKQSVAGWITAFPLIAQNNWEMRSIPDLFGEEWYFNAQNDTTPISETLSVGVTPTAVPASTTSSSASAATASASQTASSKSSIGTFKARISPATVWLSALVFCLGFLSLL